MLQRSSIITANIFICSRCDEDGVVPNETQPLDSPQKATARKTSTPLATQVQCNASAKKYCDHKKTIEDSAEEQPIQNRQSERGQRKFQTKSSLFIQDIELTKMGDIVREDRGLAMNMPDHEEQRMVLAVSLSSDPDSIAYGGSVLDAASHTDDEAS